MQHMNVLKMKTCLTQKRYKKLNIQIFCNQTLRKNRKFKFEFNNKNLRY